MDPDRRLNDLFQRLTNYERTRTGAAEWSLDNMHRLLAELPPGPVETRWVQVAGSKGKGTTVAYLEGLARTAGLRTGAFVSPHLEHVTERVRVDGEPVPGQVLVTALEKVLASADAQGLTLSFFEAITAAAVRVFREVGVDFVALEVGLGGRLDATTAVPVDAVVLTRIELEHTEILGDTLAAIATEKAHAMRPGKPVFVDPGPDVVEVFRAHAAAIGAGPMHEVTIRDAMRGAGSWRGRIEIQSADGDESVPFVLADASRFELPALGLATACLRELFPERSLALDPVVRPAQPGRFEVVEIEDGTVILDGAHTPASIAEVVAELERRFPGRPVDLLFASARDKRWREELDLLLPRVARVVITEVEGTPCAPVAELAGFVLRAGRSADVAADPLTGWHALCAADPEQAAGRPAPLRLVTGSFYLVGAVRSLVRQQG